MESSLIRSDKRRVGDWVLGRRIGRGGQGDVFEATRGEGQPIVALKYIEARKPKKRARFIQEVEKHHELSLRGARNIIPIIDHNLQELAGGAVEGYIVMPRAALNLEQAVGTTEGRIEICLEILLGVARGIGEAHRIGVIHRDIKPGNVLFMDPSLREPLVSDFGICLLKQTDDANRLTDAHETVGARFFMAPEQEKGGVADVRESADIYALGKLLVFMLTRRYVHREYFDAELRRDDLESDRRLDRIRQDILAKTIVENPEDRVQTADELIQALETILRDFRSGNGRNGAGSPIASSYKAATDVLKVSDRTAIRFAVDECRFEFDSTWAEEQSRAEALPDESPAIARDLLLRQMNGTGFTIAMARFDAVAAFGDWKQLVEYIARSTEKRSGHMKVRGIPHVTAGFLYMTAALVALSRQSWSILNDLLRTQFEWYYGSAKPRFSFGFELRYFFHSEALGKFAPKIHDLFREILALPSYSAVLGLSDEELLDSYCAAQFLMCVRAAQESVRGSMSVTMFADFGRFYDSRVFPLIERIRSDAEYARGALLPFEESREEWLQRLPERLAYVRENFFNETWFDWASIGPQDLE
ncbi:MAG TPA: protein kinase [Thermoanaerobaculia bacterium]|nr:protein kinase [Thermoanaerobaculia bacterium]